MPTAKTKVRTPPPPVTRGTLHSIWWRKSPRHKWVCEASFVLVTRDSGIVDWSMRGISWQTSDSGTKANMTASWASALLGKFPCGGERELRAPMFDVPLRKGK